MAENETGPSSLEHVLEEHVEPSVQLSEKLRGGSPEENSSRTHVQFRETRAEVPEEDASEYMCSKDCLLPAFSEEVPSMLPMELGAAAGGGQTLRPRNAGLVSIQEDEPLDDRGEVSIQAASHYEGAATLRYDSSSSSADEKDVKDAGEWQGWASQVNELLNDFHHKLVKLEWRVDHLSELCLYKALQLQEPQREQQQADSRAEQSKQSEKESRQIQSQESRKAGSVDLEDFEVSEQEPGRLEKTREVEKLAKISELSRVAQSSGSQSPRDTISTGLPAELLKKLQDGQAPLEEVDAKVEALMTSLESPAERSAAVRHGRGCDLKDDAAQNTASPRKLDEVPVEQSSMPSSPLVRDRTEMGSAGSEATSIDLISVSQQQSTLDTRECAEGAPETVSGIMDPGTTSPTGSARSSNSQSQSWCWAGSDSRATQLLLTPGISSLEVENANRHHLRAMIRGQEKLPPAAALQRLNSFLDESKVRARRSTMPADGRDLRRE
jgi:hypothetical protein